MCAGLEEVKEGRRFNIPGVGEIFNRYGTDLVTLTTFEGTVIPIEGREKIKLVSEAFRKICAERAY